MINKPTVVPNYNMEVSVRQSTSEGISLAESLWFFFFLGQFFQHHLWFGNCSVNVSAVCFRANNFLQQLKFKSDGIVVFNCVIKKVNIATRITKGRNGECFPSNLQLVLKMSADITNWKCKAELLKISVKCQRLMSLAQFVCWYALINAMSLCVHLHFTIN